LRGIGVANYVEITSGAPRERTEITVLPEGKIELVMGTMASGQGYETNFAQFISEWSTASTTSPTTRRGSPRGAAALRPIDEARRNNRRAGDRRHNRQGGGRLRATCSKPAKPTSSSRTAVSGSPAPIARLACLRWPRP
jgi:hypothetical protein